MKKIHLGILLVLAMLNSCSSPTVPTARPIDSVDELRQALIAAGVEVVVLESQESVLPGVEVQNWEVSAEPIYVFSSAEPVDGERIQEALVQMGVIAGQAEQEFQIWEHTPFLVVYPGSEGGVVLLLSGLLGDPNTRQLSGPDEPYPPAVSAAQHKLAEELGLAPTAVEVVDYEDVLWPDSCLGVEREGQVCAQVETPGWRIRLKANGEMHVVHSDAIGQQIIPVEQG